MTDGIFGFDILVNLISDYYDENDDLVTSYKKIIWNYLTLIAYTLVSLSSYNCLS